MKYFHFFTILKIIISNTKLLRDIPLIICDAIYCVLVQKTKQSLVYPLKAKEEILIMIHFILSSPRTVYSY